MKQDSLRRLTRLLGVPVIAFGVALSGSSAAHAEEIVLKDLIEGVLAEHDRVKAGEARLEASEKDAVAAAGGWTPDITLTTSYGFERQNNASGSDTSMPPREASASLSQTLWDFGGTDAAIDRAELTRRQAEYTLESTRQTMMVEAINAYLELARSRRVIGFAQGSVDNLKRQLDLENTRIEHGAGVSTDCRRSHSWPAQCRDWSRRRAPWPAP